MNASGPRWADKYRLEESGGDRGRNEAATSGASGGLGSLLGSSSVAQSDTHDVDTEGPSRKKSRLEKFQDVISTSRQHRFEAQKERSNRDKEAAQLDAEFDTLQHLLEKRDRLQEDREAFEKAGSADVRKLLESYRSSGRTSKVLKLSVDGTSFVKAEEPTQPSSELTDKKKKKSGEADAGFLDAADLKLLAKVRHGAPPPAPVAEPPKAVVAEESADEGDDFDALMGVMRLETRKAHAVERTLTEEEEIARLERARQLELERSRVPLVNTDSLQLTRKEWVARGGESAFVMNDDDDLSDNVDIDYDEEEEDGDGEVESDADEASDDEEETADEEAPTVQTHGTEVEKILQELETFAAKESAAAAQVSDDDEGHQRSAAFQALLARIHETCRRHPVSAAQTFRLLLLECQRRLIGGQRLTTFLKLVLFSLLHVYPLSDYRHGVVTPFLLYLCSSLTQHAFHSLSDCVTALQLASILTEAMSAGGGRYCAETIVAALNIIALQAPKCVLEPAAHQSLRMPCPLNRRCDAALLNAESTGFLEALGTQQMKPMSLLLNDESIGKIPTDALKVQILFNSYKLLAAIATAHASSPAFTAAVSDPVERLFSLVEAHVHPALRKTHAAVLDTIRTMATSCEKERTPLAMRHFRPRPIRLFDPLLVESVDPEVKERRELKREIREDRKRVVRQVQAEAVVERRAREREAAAEDARRTDKYHQLMSELQSQQHIMKTVDMSMAKARSKKKKSISGAPNTGEGASEE